MRRACTDPQRLPVVCWVDSHGAGAEALAAWKQNVTRCWDGVVIERCDAAPRDLEQGRPLVLDVRVRLNGLTPQDVRIECVVAGSEGEPPEKWRTFLFDAPTREEGAGADVYRASMALLPPHAGLQIYLIRMYPFHRFLAHRFEMGRMRWV